jgi:hypothetical protein
MTCHRGTRAPLAHKPQLGAISLLADRTNYAPSGSFFRRLSTAVAVVLATFSLSAQDAQYTQRGDTTRAGQYDNEVFLNPQNVNQNSFGSLFSYSVDGAVVAQPLYVPGVTIAGVGNVNALYVVTQNDSVYAFNAVATGAPLWQVSFLNAANGVTAVPISAQGCSGVTNYTEVGIMGTPVIDPTTNTMYLVAKTQEAAGSSFNYVFRLHALDITSGAEKFGGPVVITASVQNGNNQVTLNTQTALQRPALLEANGSIFIGFGSNGCDKGAHGWLLAYNAATLAQQGVFNTSPAVVWGSSLWMSGVGPASDAENNIYLVTANGTFDINTGGSDWGDTAMKLTFDGTSFTVADSFTPSNQSTMAAEDLDFGSGGAVLLPPQTTGPANLLVAAGKTGTIYLINCDDMGGYNTQDNVVQELPGAVGGIWGAPVYWNDALYFAGRSDYIKAFPFVNGVISTPPVQSTAAFTLQGVPVVSGNGSNNGIFWFIHNLSATNPAQVLAAYNASTLQTNLAKLYDTQQNSTRDALGNVPHFATPLVANGRVYIGGNTAVMVYGLFPELGPSSGNYQSATVNTPISLSVQAVNAYTGNEISGVPITFSDGGKGGTFNPVTASTSSSGIAATSYTLPKTAGLITVTASSSGYASTTLTEIGVAGPATQVGTVSGSAQSGTVNTTLPAPLVAKVVDAYGNPIANAAVTFANTGLNGTFSPNPAVTGANGSASTAFTLPTTAKNNFAVTASSGSATTATFRESSLASTPFSMVTSGGNKQVGTHGTQLPKALQVTVTDQYGNGVPNITVNFSDNGAGGTFSNPSPTTGSQGSASTMYTLPGTPGTWTITATSGTLQVSFTEIGH